MWIKTDCDEGLVELISQKFNVSPVVAKVLVSRGITDDNEVSAFLYANVDQFYDPFLLPDMASAVQRIKTAILRNEKIAVYGDYDVDGITATYILFDYLKSLGADVIYYIPDRNDEGYGLNIGAIDFLCKKDVRLIITVDVGITAFEEASHAKSIGVDLVITDHHTPTDALPDAVAVIDPKLKGHNYPNGDLAGVGVAFKLIFALSGCDRKIIDNYCEFVCVGTIADMVPLVGENRFIASYGLKRIRETQNFGLKALIEVTGIEKSKISSSNISFALAPRLNAAGRIGSAKISVDLFLAGSYDEAKKIAAALDDGNKIRQSTEQQILNDALDIIEKNNLYNDKVIVVANNDWHHGVIGIVASKITEKYYKPTLVISIDKDGSAKASGRSIAGFNLFEALSAVRDYLDKFGGHELAAGFSLQADYIDSFRKAINTYAETVFTDEMQIPKLKIDAEIFSEDITLKTARDLTMLEPYGIGNRTPVFSLLGAKVNNVKIHKDGKHAFLSFKKSNMLFSSPAFNMADEMINFSNGDVIDLAGNININDFKGRDNVQFVTKDVKTALSSSFSIENLRCVFVVVRKLILESKNKVLLSELSRFLKENYGCCFGILRLKKALEALQDVSLIELFFEGESACIFKGENFASKINITDSKTYKELNFLT